MNLLSTFVGQPREVTYHGRTISTGIFKEEITGPVTVNVLNLEGDKQADLTVHGGVDKAVYAYPSEHYTYWKKARPDLEFAPGIVGENLSVTGMFEETVCIGDIYAIGSVKFVVSGPRMPCFKLGIKMGDASFIKDFLQAQRTGFYFRVLEKGIITAGDPITKLHDDPHQLSILEVVQLYTTEKHNIELLKKAIQTPSLPQDWSVYFANRLKGR